MMRKAISYFDPECPELTTNKQSQNVFGDNAIIAKSQEEYDNIMADINNPERGITNITEIDLPDQPDVIDPMEELLFRLTSLELASGITEYAIQSLDRLSTEHKKIIDNTLKSKQTINL